MGRSYLADLLRCIAGELVEECREALPRPVRIAVMLLAAIVALMVFAPLPGAQLVRDGLGFSYSKQQSASFLERANEAARRKSRSEQ